ncbi:hypothetical protein JXB01_04310 [Candidatus Micrarchaeota archaeon]|nr:hypothetical protein [Candidatus Micrarchaeota archaeon]
MSEDLGKKFEKQVEESEWDSIAEMAKTFQIEFEEETTEVKKLKKKIKMTKRLLYEHLKNPEDAEKTVKNPAFFTGLVKTVEEFEKHLDKHKTSRKELLIFLKALLARVRKEKLKVHKTMQIKKDFQRMKKAGDKV